MKSSEIQPDGVYIAVIKGKRLKIKPDLVLCDIVHGTNVETGAGVVLHSYYFLAGPVELGFVKDSVEHGKGQATTSND